MTGQVNEAVTNLYHAVNAMLLVVGRDGEIDSRHESTAAVMQALRAIDGGQYIPELQIQARPSRGVVDVDAILALVAGPHKYHHKMDERAEREANAFNRCRDLTIQNIKALFALQAAALPAAPVAMAIDPQLAAFYQVATVAELLAAQEEHIQKLQDSARRNVKPWEDTFPPTLLPKYLRDSGLTPTRNNMEQVRREAFNLADTVIEWIESGNVQAARDAIRDSLAAIAAQPAVPSVPEDWVLVPREPTERMVVDGFESAPNEFFSPPAVWEEYQQMSGCQQAAHRARLCYAAMIAAAPQPEEPTA